jgi:hypothetical protein
MEEMIPENETGLHNANKASVSPANGYTLAMATLLPNQTKTNNVMNEICNDLKKSRIFIDRL